MLDSQDPEALFRTSRDDFEKYPLNLVRTDTFQHALESYRNRLRDDRLFHPTARSFFLWDLVKDEAGAQSFKASGNLPGLDALSERLDGGAGDPLWRFAFIQSLSSRDPLGCTKDQLVKLLTHHQVMPAFLDFVFTFKRRTSPLAHAFFRYEDHLEDGDPLPLPSVGRSGCQIQHAFNFLSVERSEFPNEKNPWPLRQTCLHYSFDMVTGRSFWIILKGNRVIREQIKKAVDSHRLLQPGSITTAEQSFIAALQIHLVIMNWGVESWSEYVDYLEEDVKKKALEGKVVPIAEMENHESFTRLTSSPNLATTSPKQASFDRSRSLPVRPLASPPTSPPASPPAIGIVRSASELFRRGFKVSAALTPVPETNGDRVDESLAEDAQMLAEIHKKFSFNEFQRFSMLSDELEKALLVIDQNRGVLAEIRDHYQDIISSPVFASNLDKEACQGGIATFFRKIKSFDRELDIHRARLRAILKTLENDKIMFQAIFQFKSEKGAELFARSAKTSSDRMELWTEKMHTIAVSTKQDTVSMHVITIFTLVFLPGTFLAVRLLTFLLIGRWMIPDLTFSWWQTFFSSGVLRWDEDGTMGSDWVTRPEGIRLFMAICVPMMTIILAGWSVVYYYTRRSVKQARARSRILTAEEGLRDGKGGEGLIGGGP